MTASDLLLAHNIPIHYNINAIGTASSEMADILNLGSSEKRLLISFLPEDVANMILIKLYHVLHLGAVNGGIAFTLPLNAKTKHAHRMMRDIEEKNEDNFRRGEVIMSDTKYAMISVMVEMGYSEEVMNAARGAGARGGTVVHSRGVENSEASAVWGISLQEEKEIVLIIVPEDKKTDIMKAIGELCGVNSEAKGIVMSMPIDHVIGIN
jgi:hypothetical protein